MNYYSKIGLRNNEWFLVGINLNLSKPKKVSSSSIRSQLKKVPSFSPHFSLFESPSWPSVLHFYPRCLRILWVTSPLLIVLASKKGNHWVLVTFLFILELWDHLIQLEWGNVGVTYKLLVVWDIPNYLSLTGTRPISASHPL